MVENQSGEIEQAGLAAALSSHLCSAAQSRGGAVPSVQTGTCEADYRAPCTTDRWSTDGAEVTTYIT